LCFFFSDFQFILIDLCFGVIPSSGVNKCLVDRISSKGDAYCRFETGGAGIHFGDERHSLFECNGKYSGYFIEGWQSNYVSHFFFNFSLPTILILFALMCSYV
jgi:hypothetical protein